jgi:hypothetical protein
MSTRAARVLVSTNAPTAAIRHLVKLPVNSIIGNNLYAELRDELGSDRAAVEFLGALADEVQHPLFINFEHAEGSTTLALSPPGWSEERLQGWTAGQVEHLEELFGPAELRRIGE